MHYYVDIEYYFSCRYMYVHVVHKSNIDRYIGLLQRSQFDVLIFLTFHILRCTGHSRPHNIQLKKHEPDK